ncbi:spore gernimation protein [uncultured Photobacterium sp.]|uniref:spore gernimation protein n=1 Tax=uncultured Photobacterium sp. TaxID=173973 RepID=UPI0026245338|nr:spore gernimation protein [uncultured Photobacterium sp.]
MLRILSNKILLVGAVLMLLPGCGEEFQLTATPVKNVEKIVVSEPGQVDVYCPTGICQFELAANKEASVTVNMHYDISRRFSKIEGVSVAGELSSSVTMKGENSFSLDVPGNVEPSKVQVVDYYRN